MNLRKIVIKPRSIYFALPVAGNARPFTQARVKYQSSTAGHSQKQLALQTQKDVRSKS